ncbi:MAG TPA: MarR family winged helix-turn-helix transcriptional regulator [Candidatus Saccharimonadales bacterium]|nr:MarR family winged helix-turn-helix transcriptional regulator [Candidatus Saccharimonadales bacterium]
MKVNKPDNKDIFSVKKAEDSSGFLLWQVTSLWQRSLNRLLKKHKLTQPQYVVLASVQWLSLSSPHVTQSDISSHAKMDKMLVSNLVKTLESKKLINRFPSKQDTRANIIVPTQVGIKLLTSAVKEVEGFDRHFVSPLGKEVAKFNSYLLKLIESNKE